MGVLDANFLFHNQPSSFATQSTRLIHRGLFTDSVAASKIPSQDALEEGCE